MRIRLNFFLSLFIASLTFVIAEDLVSYCLTGDDGIVITLTEEEHAKEGFEKEIKLFTSNRILQTIYNEGTILKHNYPGTHFFYSNPFIRKEIKPPHIA